ncbi:MAG: YtxH domain-containing protein [Anaerolineae bacterium]|nr:YtxH domain-containing protein [Anaerolineae bacterium]
MSDRDEFGAFLVGFIVGGLTGAVVSLLMAPQTGEETRAIIKDKSIELRDRAQMTAEEALAKAEGIAVEYRARADELARDLRDRGSEVISTARAKSKETVESVKKAATRKPTSKASAKKTSGPGAA